MNPSFWILIGIGAACLWFLLSFIFVPLGNRLIKRWNKTKERLNTKYEEGKEKRSEEHTSELQSHAY